MGAWQSFIADGIFLSLSQCRYIALTDDNIINRTDPIEQNLIDCWNFKFDDEAHYWDMHRLMTIMMIVVMVVVVVML